MTKHPCHGRSAAAIEVFETIAVGQTPPYRPRTIAALQKAGLIELVGMRPLGQDRFGHIKVPVYQVPIPIHMQWCQWAKENVPEPDEEQNDGSRDGH